MKECLKHYCIHVVGRCIMGHRVAKNRALQFNIGISATIREAQSSPLRCQKRGAGSPHDKWLWQVLTTSFSHSDGVEACLPHLQQQFHSYESVALTIQPFNLWGNQNSAKKIRAVSRPAQGQDVTLSFGMKGLVFLPFLPLSPGEGHRLRHWSLVAEEKEVRGIPTFR